MKYLVWNFLYGILIFMKTIYRLTDKKKIVFYYDHTAAFEVDPEFQKLWRSVGVDSIDDDKITEYLEKQGLK